MAETATKRAKPAAKPAVKRAKKPPPPVYTVVVTHDEEGHWVACAPALNDCGSFGDSLPEALQMAEEAIGLYLEVQRENDWPLPPDDPRVCVDVSEATEAFVCRLRIRESHGCA